MIKIGIVIILAFIWSVIGAIAVEDNFDTIWLEYNAYVKGDGFSGQIKLFNETENGTRHVIIVPGKITLKIYDAGSDKLLGTKEFIVTSDYYGHSLDRNGPDPFVFHIPRIPFSEFADNKLDAIVWNVEAIYESEPDWLIYDAITVSCVETVMA